MNTTKVALILGLTIMGLMGALHYMKSEDTPVIKVDSDLGIENLQERVDSFKEWMQKYNKKYSLAETHQRFLIWNKAYDTVREHNAKGLSWELEVNMFADLTNEEFAAIYLGYKHDPNRVRENVVYLDTSNAPSTVDWRKKGAVTGVKDQGQCGSCYTFSSAAALEGLHFIKKGTLISLSEQQQLDCSKSYGNQGCNGGLMDNCFKYTKDKGIQKEDDYKYTGSVGTCRYDSSKIVYKNTGYTDVPANDPAQLRAALNKQPVSVAVEADEDAFKLYKSGIITANCGTNLDHGITAVGYGANYWIIKNSWGANWGEQGYVRIAQGTQNNGAGVCGINSSNSYPTLN